MRNVFYHFPLCSIYYESYDCVLQTVSIKAENKYGWPWGGVKKTFSDPPPSAPSGDKKKDFYRLILYLYQSNRNAMKWTILRKKIGCDRPPRHLYSK